MLKIPTPLAVDGGFEEVWDTWFSGLPVIVDMASSTVLVMSTRDYTMFFLGQLKRCYSYCLNSFIYMISKAN